MASRVEKQQLTKILGNLDSNEQAMLMDIAKQIESKAKQYTPVKTGKNLRSIYTRTYDSNPQPQDSDFELPRPASNKSVNIGATTDYSFYLEMGTKLQPARPYVTKAANEVEASLGTSKQYIKRIIYE